MIREAIENHPHYTLDDHAYLKAKGWTDREILDYWEAERRVGKGPVHWDDEHGLLELWRALAAAEFE